MFKFASCNVDMWARGQFGERGVKGRDSVTENIIAYLIIDIGLVGVQGTLPSPFPNPCFRPTHVDGDHRRPRVVTVVSDSGFPRRAAAVYLGISQV